MDAPPDLPAAGLLLLTGGRGRRLGVPKHRLPHPAGGTWGGHLVEVFLAVFPAGPVQVLGEPLVDRPGLPVAADPRRGPAAALRSWAASCRVPVRRWWVVGCDQVRWTSADLADWYARAADRDPEAGSWILARCDGRVQPLGGFLPGALLERLAGIPATALMGLVDAVPHVALPAAGDAWRDVDTPAELRAWLAAHPGPAPGDPLASGGRAF